MKPYQNQDQIRLVLADVDGTLVTQEKVLTAKTKEAVSQLTAAGIAFAITSDRPPRGMQMVIKDVNLSTVVAGFNGGVYTTAKLDPIVMRDLPRDAAGMPPPVSMPPTASLANRPSSSMLCFARSPPIWSRCAPNAANLALENVAQKTINYLPNLVKKCAPHHTETGRRIYPKCALS